MTAPILADSADRDRILTDLDSTLVVEAAAGTGKTTALVGRILALIRAGRSTLSRVVAVTFTEKAAGEMKIRLRTEIEKARAQATTEQRAFLDTALRELEAARIGTIHGLCRDILGERPVEARIDPMFEVAADGEAEGLFAEAFERWFPRLLDDPPEGVRRLMRRPSGWQSTPRDQLRGAGWRLAEHRDFDGPWRRDPFDRHGAIDRIVDRLRQLGDLVGRCTQDNNLAANLERVHRWVEELDRAESLRGRDHDRVEVLVRQLARNRWMGWHHKGYGDMLGPDLSRDDALAMRDDIKAELDGVSARCDADLVACLREELRPLIAEYEQLKKRAGQLDFIDLLLCTRDLLRSDEGVREELQGRFDHILVDEFQDTDPLQVQIVLLLCSDDPKVSDSDAVRVTPGKLFVVGDPKQSVYRFRRADIALYESVRQRLEDQGAGMVELSVSFRSDPRIQAAVNAAFEPVMQGAPQARYVPLRPWRRPDLRRPAVVALPVPEPYGKYGVYKNAVEASLPAGVAGWIDWLLNSSGWQIEDVGTGEPRDIRSSDICLLFKRFRKWGNVQATAPYVKALEVRSIPHVLVGGRTLHDREEVAALRAALTALEWPDDELSVFATLKGPLFAIPDDALLAWRDTMGRLHPLRPVAEDAELSEPVRMVADGLAVLRELHRARNRRPIADTVGRLLETTRAWAGFANWNAGDQVLANVLRIAELGRRFEARGATSFRAFVEHLANEAERRETAQAPVVEEGTEGVRLMTVHKAKGLQFPVVILCDMTASVVGRNPSRYVDNDTGSLFVSLAGCVPTELEEHRDEVLARDEEEAHRVLYVAATRARDILVIPGVGDEPQDGWVDLLNPVIYPKRAARQASSDGPGCPPFGRDTVADRGQGRARFSSSTVGPGKHVSETGTEVVWWDPTVLPVSARPTHGLRRHWLLMEDPDGKTTERGIRAHDAWQAAREARLAAASRPSLDVVPVRERAESGPSGSGVEVPLLQTDAGRVGRSQGRRFGALIHAVLAEVLLDADAAAIDALVSVHARVVGATVQEADGARDGVAAALRHDLLVRAGRADEVRREDPVLVVDGDQLVEGTLDLAFREGEAWTVVEFKSVLADDEARTQAEEQVCWYARGVAAATGQPATGVLLLV